MMQFIRDHAQGWIAWVIVGLICIPFALWGVQEYLGVDPNVTVAEVNGEEVGLQRFQQAYQRNRAQLGVAIDDPALEQQLRMDTVERLVQDEVIVQTAIATGLRISDEQLARAIQSQAAFQNDGAFSQAAYERFVRNQGFSPGGFEFNYRRTLLADQIFSGLVDTAFATQNEADALLRLRDQQRTFSSLKLERAKFALETLPDAEVEAWYQQNKPSFRSTEQVKLAYLMLDKQALASEFNAKEDELRSLYEARKGILTRPEERRALHILVAVGRQASEGDVAAAKTKAEGLHKQLVDGGDFSALAKANSDDSASGAKGGDLGFFAKGWMAPEFEAAAFALSLGELSEPVRTSFGFHIIRLEETRGADVPTFAAVRDQMLADYQADKSEGEFYARVERLQNLAYEQPDNLDVAAEELGLNIETSAFVTRAGVQDNPVLSNANILRAAFSEDVLRGGNNSEVLDVDGGNSAAVVRVIEHKISAEQPLESVREAVETAIRTERAAEASRDAGEALVARLRGGESALEVAADVGLTWKDHSGAKRTDTGDYANARQLAFKMPRPGEKATVDGVATAAGDYVVVRLTQVVETEKSAASGDDETLNAQTDLVQRAAGNSAFQNLLESLRDDAEVVLHENRF
jgi:peptidyl-prolyl cis-trans isomerase D